MKKSKKIEQVLLKRKEQVLTTKKYAEEFRKLVAGYLETYNYEDGMFHIKYDDISKELIGGSECALLNDDLFPECFISYTYFLNDKRAIKKGNRYKGLPSFYVDGSVDFKLLNDILLDDGIMIDVDIPAEDKNFLDQALAFVSVKFSAKSLDLSREEKLEKKKK